MEKQAVFTIENITESITYAIPILIALVVVYTFLDFKKTITDFKTKIQAKVVVKSIYIVARGVLIITTLYVLMKNPEITKNVLLGMKNVFISIFMK